MTLTLTAQEERLRQAFKIMNRFMLTMWRLGLGGMMNAWPETGGRIMVLTHTGRKSGLRRRTPVNYAEVAGQVYCTSGFGAGSDWYKNMIAQPQVEVWLPQGWWQAVAEEVPQEDEHWLYLLRQVLIGSGFAARVAGINPHTISDDELAEVAKDYRLFRIRRKEACTGPEGPGDLAWVWPLATFVLLPLALRRRNRRCC